MEGGRPGRFAIAAMAVAAGWSALWLLGQVGSESPRMIGPPLPVPPAEERERAPLRSASGYLCPPGWPYGAYASGADRYYPPNHPLRPARVVRPDRCYTTPGDAEAAGYVLAPPSPGGLAVDGVYLVFVDLDVQCIQAADRVGFAIPCPTRLPNPGSGSPPARCGDRTSFGRFTRPPCVYRRAFLLDQAGFAVPPGYGAGALGGTHLIVTASRGKDPSRPPAILRCSTARVVGSMVVRPVNANRYLPALVLVCPEGVVALDEYLILGWTESGVVYQLAVNGDIPANRRLLEAIASNIKMVGPESTES